MFLKSIRSTTRPGYNWLVSATAVLSNTTALEISVGSGHNALDSYTTNEKLTRTGAGMSSLPMLFPDVVQDDMVPSVAFGGGRVGSRGDDSTPCSCHSRTSTPRTTWSEPDEGCRRAQI